MRLIDTETGEFVECVDLEKAPPFAVLSHTWATSGEQSYQEVVKIQERYRHYPPSEKEALPNSRSDKPATPSELDLLNDTQTPPTSPTIRHSIWDSDSGLSEKVRGACQIARRDGYRYIWIDSSCINKSSSSELSEAINSMFNWYRAAQVCYAFLADVPSDEDVRVEGSKFRESRWFERCWTLQELIAPLVVVFLSQDWEGLGTKDALADLIQDITSIDGGILTHERAFSDESVADRMRWAANRQATRVEDEAYSLLGIFDITMPTLYGEGQRAFRRLQEEILERIPDQSIFAWGDCVPFPMTPATISLAGDESEDYQTPLAPSPHFFASSKRSTIVRATRDSIKSLELPVENYTHTPFGIRTNLCLLPLQAVNPALKINTTSGRDSGPWYLVVLSCQHAGDKQRLLSRLCCLRRGKADVEFLLVPKWTSLDVDSSGRPVSLCMFTLSLKDLARVRTSLRAKGQLQTKTVYLPHPKSSVTTRRIHRETNASIKWTLSTWAPAALRIRGYTTSISNIQGPTELDDHNSFSLSLLHDSSLSIHIHFRYMTHDNGDKVLIQAYIWILSSSEEAPIQARPSVIQCSPPYTSSTWTDCLPCAMTLPARSSNFTTDTGEQVTLRLGLGLTAPSQYNIRVDVTPASNGLAEVGMASLRADSRTQPRVRLYAPHETFNPILTGSVRRALELKGYSSYLALDPRLGGFRTHSLILSRNADSLAIVVKFLCTLVNVSWDSQKLVVVARITLEPSIPTHEVVVQPSEAWDGPYVIIWRNHWRKDSSPWQSLRDNHVILLTPTGKPLTLHLGFDLAYQSEYHLRVDIEPSTSRFQSPELSRLPGINRHWNDHYTLPLAHRSIDLTLPGHVRRALQAQGYEVRFEGPGLDGGPGGSGDPVRHLLTLSHIPAGISIVIEYSHRLPVITRSRDPEKHHGLDLCDNNYPFLLADPHPDSGLSAPVDKVQWKRCQQDLIFQASARILPFRSSDTGSPAAVHGDLTTRRTVTVDWNAKYGYDHHDAKVDDWRGNLPNKDITLTLPTGDQLVLRLGFYYVWYSEYCLMVKINPRIPLSRTPSRPNTPPPVPDYERDKAGMEYIQRQSLARSTELGQLEEDHDEPLPTDLDRSTDGATRGSAGQEKRWRWRRKWS